jgi:hypothetical protein
MFTTKMKMMFAAGLAAMAFGGVNATVASAHLPDWTNAYNKATTYCRAHHSNCVWTSSSDNAMHERVMYFAVGSPKHCGYNTRAHEHRGIGVDHNMKVTNDFNAGCY